MQLQLPKADFQGKFKEKDIRLQNIYTASLFYGSARGDLLIKKKKFE
jgi:hypothetical protein